MPWPTPPATMRSNRYWLTTLTTGLSPSTLEKPIGNTSLLPGMGAMRVPLPAAGINATTSRPAHCRVIDGL